VVDSAPAIEHSALSGARYGSSSMGWVSSLDDVQMMRTDIQTIVAAKLIAVRYFALD
jgi:hypothetical protein